jgi:hypothetical protein
MAAACSQAWWRIWNARRDELRCRGVWAVIKPWKDIKAFYQEFVESGSPLEGMVRLIGEIEASRYAN